MKILSAIAIITLFLASYGCGCGCGGDGMATVNPSGFEGAYSLTKLGPTPLPSPISEDTAAQTKTELTAGSMEVMDGVSGWLSYTYTTTNIATNVPSDKPKKFPFTYTIRDGVFEMTVSDGDQRGTVSKGRATLGEISLPLGPSSEEFVFTLTPYK